MRKRFSTKTRKGFKSRFHFGCHGLMKKLALLPSLVGRHAGFVSERLRLNFRCLMLSELFFVQEEN